MSTINFREVVEMFKGLLSYALKPASEINSELTARGCSLRQIERAKDELRASGVAVAQNTSGRWYWSLR